LRCFGLTSQPAADASVLIIPEDSARVPTDWLARVDHGALVVVEGGSEAARALGFRATSRRVRVRKIAEERDTELPISWEHAIDLPVFETPKKARIFCRDREYGAPLMAGFRRGRGGVLWMAVGPGEQGYERFPYLLQALSDLGLSPLFESRRLWAFFDAAFRKDDEVDRLALEWRRAGIAAIHAGAWHYFEPSAKEDAYLERLIAACHRQGILVYAWLELPHVSRRFWDDHPAWREKTALLRDARVDWRLLMNLMNPDCRRAVAEGVRTLLMRFDWDGVNFAELYFDGTEGLAKLDEFTPLNQDVRGDVRRTLGFDPAELFTGQPRNPGKLRAFLDYRADLAARLQEGWIAELERIREEKPHLDLVLTHVDDRFDTNMRDAIGADAARLLRLLDSHRMTFVIEDPGTVWHLGPQRYAEIAKRYRPLTPHQDRLAVDINVVERDHVVYPTRQQAGVELAQLIRVASESFSRVIYYFVYSISPTDLPLLAPASAVVTRCERSGQGLLVESPHGVGVRWAGPVTLDGRSWPVRDDARVWVPRGKHVIEPAATPAAARVLDFTGELESAAIRADGIELVYTSESRALAKLERMPVGLMVDGRAASLDVTGEYVVRLPRGKHTVLLRTSLFP
jgi:hypothetical protein